MSSETGIRPFRVDMPDDAITDLRRRITATRRPSRELVADRSQGVQLATIQELSRYWATEYDWRRCEAQLNALPQFMTGIDGVDQAVPIPDSRTQTYISRVAGMPLSATLAWRQIGGSRAVAAARLRSRLHRQIRAIAGPRCPRWPAGCPGDRGCRGSHRRPPAGVVLIRARANRTGAV
jgi:hypothetical protein